VFPVGVARRRHHTGLIATKAARCCCNASLEGWRTQRAHRVPDSSACGCVRALRARGCHIPRPVDMRRLLSLSAAGPSAQNMQADETSPPAISSRLRDSPASKDAAFAIRVSTPPSERPKSQFPGLGKSPDGTLYATPDVRLHHRAVLVAAGDDGTGSLGGLVRQLSIDQFENESRRVSIGTPGTDAGLKRTTTPTLDRTAAVAGIHKTVLAVLLRPREWRPQADRCAICSAH